MTFTILSIKQVDLDTQLKIWVFESYSFIQQRFKKFRHKYELKTLIIVKYNSNRDS